jgi:2'-5' RNA ligase
MKISVRHINIQRIKYHVCTLRLVQDLIKLKEDKNTRAFVAIEFLGMEVLEPLIDELRSYPWLKTVRTTQMHLTLKFYEDISEAYSKEICGYIKEIRHSRFDAVFRGIDCFPGRGNCRVLILTSTSNEIMAIWKDLIKSVGREKGERGLVPHLTLGRIKSLPIKQKIDQVLDKKIEISLRADRVSLIRSSLTPEGPQYTEICRSQLI